VIIDRERNKPRVILHGCQEVAVRYFNRHMRRRECPKSGIYGFVRDCSISGIYIMKVRRTRDSLKAKHKLCPECGASMAVGDQCTENGALFRWYYCTRDDCDGQWLEKEILAWFKSA
jgi:hypothetical protein